MLQDILQHYCSTAQWNTIGQFCNLLKTANQTINLVSRRDSDNLLEHHVAPSFAYRILERLQPQEQVLDIGSGGGFPGIINAILFPETQFVLVDSTKKKVSFLQDTITTLQLQNAQALWSRVEDLALDTTYQANFDHTTARAVASLVDLITWSKPLLKTNGTVEAMKGGDIQPEINDLNVGTRQSVFLQKIYHLPKQLLLNEKLSSLVIISLRLNHR